jgi:hypothetical protein
VRSYAAYDRNGIKDVLNLDGTGPELLQQTWEGTNRTDEARSGYYVTTAYEQRGAYWYRTDGRHGAQTFPLYEKWAILPNTRPEVVTNPELPREWLSDYGNDPRSGVRTNVLWLDEHGIHAGADLGCELESIDVVIKDSRGGREVEVGPYASSSDTLLPEVARKGVRATLTGLHRWPHSSLCTASIAWLTP